MRFKKLSYAFAAVIIAAISLCAVSALAQYRFRRPNFNRFRFRFIGPAIGNRVAAVVGVPGDPNVYYAGASSGGVWKSVDGGNTWHPIFDKEPVQAIGALAISESSPNIVWAGTGEAWEIRDSDLMGDGVYKSIDAGKTWTRMGLDITGRIGRIVVNPTNPDNVFVCALGRTTGPQQSRGVFRTMDGGKTWQRVLFVNENTGCSGLSMDAENHQTLFAGMWQVTMHTWALEDGGPGSGVYVSHDGGTTWTHIVGHGLPKPPVGKIDVAVAPSDSNRVYALIETKDQGSVWRSDDGGNNWRVVNWQRPLIGRAGYYIRLAVSPANENEVLIANSSFFRSIDGGLTFKEVPWGGDNHDIWFDPKNANRIAMTDDEGLFITVNGGLGLHHVTLPIGQMYHVAVDNQVPYDVYSNMQDDGNMRGPSTSLGFSFGGGHQADWDHGMGGCESGWTLPDPVNPNIVWATCYGDEVTVYNAKTKETRSVSPWMHTLDSPPNETKYRCHWTPPLAIDPFDHNTVYYGCQVIFKTSNGGQSWSVISPDLSTQDPSRIVSSGGIVGDNLGQFYGEVVFAIAPSPLQKGLIWAGTNDGKVWYTRDGGGHWNDVTQNVGMPVWGTVSKIEPSHFDAGTAYIAVDYHLMDNRDPFIYKTTDFGKTWQRINSNLPTGPLAYVKSVAEDPNRKGLLFAGTGNGFYYSADDGGSWTQLQGGLPHAPVTWIEVQKTFHDVVVSTYGRGIYILDDVTPLEQMKQETSEAIVLYKPRPTYRFQNNRAYINFSVKSGGPVDVKILDSNGKLVRDLHQLPAHAGLNRRNWDLRYDPPRLVKLRTAAPDNPYIWEEARYRNADSRSITHWGIGQAQVGPIVAPGNYTIQVRVGGQTYKEPIEVLRSPDTPGSDADLTASVKAQLRVRDDITAVSDMVNRIEWTRKQVEDVEKMSRAENPGSELAKSARAMDEKLED